MIKVIVWMSAVLVVVPALPVADERPHQFEPQQPLYDQEPEFKAHPSPYKEEPPKPYAFDYGVRDDYSGANYGHSETSNGNSVEGSYQVALPDGRIQIVKYVADHKNGFQAQVEYEGEARYPEHKPQEKPLYEPQPHKQPSYEPEPYQPPQPQYKPPQPQYKPPQPQYHPPPHKKQSFKQVPQYHSSEPEPSYQEAPEDLPIYHPDVGPEFK
ncbi:Cuticle Protein CPR RR-2 [Hyalella azteca]|uniref:Cuticle Protein CPR RR-2 n=1 Tax=Hyalella azteca TaxID=294128 RepID=A0A6A0GUB9_HYAAZ|nr:cuticle protein 7 [Hyalella azteca]KAA0188552.1 Cuticle Protein CPR RR-2 [Hyalella azteca]